MKHPAGLYLLSGTEMAERFSYYGMRALFMLYMTNALMLSVEDAAHIYGSYTGLVYLTPLIGGVVADKVWGKRRSIFWGGIVMAIGQFFMFLSASLVESTELAKALMFCGLGFLIFGNGFFKPNISTMVGDLYTAEDKRRDSAFTIFYMGINIGATLAPLWCGWIGDIDYKWGFLSACIAMVAAVIAQRCLQNRYLISPEGKQVGLPPVKENTVKQKVVNTDKSSPVSTMYKSLCAIGFVVLVLLFSFNYDTLPSASLDGGVGSLLSTVFADADWIGAFIYSACIITPIYIIIDPSLTSQERKKIVVIYIIAFFVIFFWAAYEQAGASLMVFADRNVDRTFFGWTMPTAWTQILPGLFVVLLAPIFAWLWSMLDKHHIEPSAPMKQSFGLIFLAIGYLVIALGVKGVDTDTKVSLLWLVALYLIHEFGELCLSPIGLSMVNQLSPARMSSLLMGVWFMSTAASNKFAGMLSGLYPHDGEVKHLLGWEIANLSDFFMVFVVISGIAGIVLMLIAPKLKKMME